MKRADIHLLLRILSFGLRLFRYRRRPQSEAEGGR